ncbi:DNA topoisomerase I [Solidesulfovibrio carbinoliphilus subsp. oakridgensis]|uniref:DNA topoisomerase 1 n=1 Tax=Solidesulfovibrio carbinoliphilus subsp. oakridgensis TaxID=694327 RepID=G7QB84_9BACT|nr:type I DNA topoisomerase [Solidesulfovibrio carbinoliphilus]EHJ48826.1 DNA topoisomerase I [Solidesulfovibrio carbinoliphilus subsp. oakridgensis]
MKNLLIVESPGKIKKIQGFLGNDWQVMASVGHVRDLPPHDLGIDEADLRPRYVPTERGRTVLAKLARAVELADSVFLATDPDREGEAIAWHLADALALRNPQRITYTEITEQAVKGAILKPRQLDMRLVAAQEGRRVLDRLVGYKVSGPLSRLAGRKSSAGRVQSPAVRLVVEREREIRAFKVTTHYGVDLIFDALDNITPGWKAEWKVKPWLEPGQEYLLDKALATTVAGVRRVTVLSCEESESRAAPPAPFTTSTLQQAASNALKMSPKETMGLAQRLYEAGHITYMRTDSPNLSEEAVASIQEYCRSRNWPVVAKPRHWKSKEGAQEAHEAIRPTHIEIEEAGETEGEKALYALIRQRTLASQLVDAVFAVRTVRLVGNPVEDRGPEFEAKGRTLTSPGWKVVLGGDQADEGEEEAENPVPKLQAGSQLTVGEGKVTIHKTKPPARFSEASLVKALEDRGIGRPSTYAAILENILRREYVRLEKRKLAPTPAGEDVVDALLGRFGFVDFSYTKGMEENLDALAAGQARYLDVMRQFTSGLDGELSAFLATINHACPECGKPLRRISKASGKDGRGGYDFWGCTGYPDCRATFANEDGKPGGRIEPRQKLPLSAVKCPECGKPLVHRMKEGAKGYNFWGCSGYPNCKVSFPDAGDRPDMQGDKS